MGIELIINDLEKKGITLSSGQKGAITRFVNKNCSYYFFLNFIRMTNGNVKDAITLYILDEKLRLLILKYILRLEIQMKKDFISTVEKATKNDCFWNKEQYYRNKFVQKGFDNLLRSCEKRMKEMKFTGEGPNNNRMFYSTSFGTFKKIYTNLNGDYLNEFKKLYLQNTGTRDELNAYLNAILIIRNRCGHSNHLISSKFKYILESSNIVLNDFGENYLDTNFNKVLYFINSSLTNKKEMKNDFAKLLNKYSKTWLIYSGRHILNENTLKLVEEIWE